MSEEKTTAENRQDASFLLELWILIRPYALCLLKDFFITTGLWALLWSFKSFTSVTPIEGWAGEFITNLHAAGIVVAYGLFVGLFAWDIITIYRGKHE